MQAVSLAQVSRALVRRSMYVTSRTSPVLATAVRVPSGVRWMTTSRPALASEDNRGDMHPAFPPGFEKLGQSPDALAALQQLTKVLQQNGVDVTGKTRPSMVQLATLATKKEVREATAKVVEELKKVGVDLTPERLQSLMNGDFSSK